MAIGLRPRAIINILAFKMFGKKLFRINNARRPWKIATENLLAKGMGKLQEGTTLGWDEIKKFTTHARNLAIKQFINIYKLHKDRYDDELKWGDEIEYNIVQFQDENRSAKLASKAHSIIQKVFGVQNNNLSGKESFWYPEYSNYMMEGTPFKPYGGKLADFKLVEKNMNKRRVFVEKFLLPNESLMSSNFLRVGCPSFTVPEYLCTRDSENSLSNSNYIPDEVITDHKIYESVTSSLRSRRGDKVTCDVRVFLDSSTKIPVDGSQTNSPNTVHLDCIGFGMGYCCLQVTFQALNFTIARKLHDQLATFAPIMLALTASTPAYRGYLVDSDCRWNITKALWDDRTKEERGILPMKEDQLRVTKLRYDSIAMFISTEAEKYNDGAFEYEETVYQKLREAKFDHLTSQFAAHFFTHDTLILFDNELDNEEDEHASIYNNLCLTILPSVRLKLPPNASIGWRVELRTMESQITDFESAAFVCFVNLVTRLILDKDLNLLIPISRVDENMEKAQTRDAVNNEKFWFRKLINKSQNKNVIENNESIYDKSELMTVNQIINGNNSFRGLIPLIKDYVDSMEVDMDTQNLIHKYLELVGKRASGELLTAASWIRKEVVNHPGYRNDSVITDEINYDLLRKMKNIQDKVIGCPELLGV